MEIEPNFDVGPFQPQRYRDAKAQIHAQAAFTPWKDPGVYPQSLSWRSGKKKKGLLHSGIEPWSSSRFADWDLVRSAICFMSKERLRDCTLHIPSGLE
jgi:hypothetical protein